MKDDERSASGVPQIAISAAAAISFSSEKLLKDELLHHVALCAHLFSLSYLFCSQRFQCYTLELCMPEHVLVERGCALDKLPGFLITPATAVLTLPALLLGATFATRGSWPYY